VSDCNGSTSMRRSATAELHSGHGSLFLGVSIRSASASAAFYLGTWKITSAVVPAWSDSARKPDAAEMKTLVGTAVVFTADTIRGPSALACSALRYQVRDHPADMLFHGAFGEMHERN